jgi:hypothetical protein
VLKRTRRGTFASVVVAPPSSALRFVDTAVVVVVAVGVVVVDEVGADGPCDTPLDATGTSPEGDDDDEGSATGGDEEEEEAAGGAVLDVLRIVSYRVLHVTECL